MWTLALQQLGFQLVWLACALGAAADRPGVGVGAAGAFAGTLLIRGPLPRLEGLRLATAGLVLGAGLDAAFVASGAVVYPTPGLAAGLGPAWIPALWMAFALTVPRAFGWLRARLFLAALLGAAGGPLAYASGQRLGAVSLPGDAFGFGVLAIGWALALPALLALSQGGDRRGSAPAAGDRASR